MDNATIAQRIAEQGAVIKNSVNSGTVDKVAINAAVDELDKHAGEITKTEPAPVAPVSVSADTTVAEPAVSASTGTAAG